MGFKKIMIFQLFLLLILPITLVQATVVWVEDFEVALIENLSDWDFFGYEFITITSDYDTYQYTRESGFTVSDGILQPPDNQNFNTSSVAIHDSSVAYGNWSFDWFVQSGSEHRSAHWVFFMSTDLQSNYNWSGLTHATITGYWLILRSGDISDFESTFTFSGPTIELWKANSPDQDSPRLLGTSSSFSSPIEGSHHIKITRDLDGQFQVFYDLILIISAIDNNTTTSEKFIYLPWVGGASIDNITVSDSVDVTTTYDDSNDVTTTDFPGVFILVSIGAMIILRRRLNKI